MPGSSTSTLSYFDLPFPHHNIVKLPVPVRMAAFGHLLFRRRPKPRHSTTLVLGRREGEPVSNVMYDPVWVEIIIINIVSPACCLQKVATCPSSAQRRSLIRYVTVLDKRHIEPGALPTFSLPPAVVCISVIESQDVAYSSTDMDQ
jgi:hypothetical protein